MTDMQVYEERQPERARVEAGIVARQEFSGQELARSAEIGSTALATQAKAEVEARYIVALQRPRNWLNARQRMLSECERPSFADVAIYRKPIGGDKVVEGLSIRFAEAALRASGNIHVSKVVIADDADKRTVRVTATDLEANTSESVDVIIDKTVERKFLKKGQKAIATRVNSYGEIVHIVHGSEGEILTKQKAEVAKAKREVLLGLIPGDILEECKARIYATQDRQDAADPQAAIKTICDAFAVLGVRPSDLEQLLGHAIAASSPAEIGKLRGAYVCMKDGEATWVEILAAERGETGEKVDPKAASLRAKLANAGKKKGTQKAATPSNTSMTDEDRARAIDSGEDERRPGED